MFLKPTIEHDGHIVKHTRITLGIDRRIRKKGEALLLGSSAGCVVSK